MTEELYMPVETLFSAALKDEANGLASDTFGNKWQVINLDKINHKTEIQVLRLTLQHPDHNETKTAILKFVNPLSYGHADFIPSDFQEELINYQYLQRIQSRFDRFPTMYRHTGRMFLMEDLGPDTYAFDSLHQIVDSLAETLQQLHQASRDTAQLYEQVRQEAGLGADVRRYGPEGCALIFQKGCTMLLEFFSLLGLPGAERLEMQLQHAGCLVLSPGPFWSFVHDDLADRRQSVVIDGKIILLDFEHGKFFHSLIDLGKLLMGKIERDNDKKAMVYHHPYVPSELGQVYYEKWLNAGGAPSYADFQLHFAAANIFQTMLIIGRLSELQGTEVLYSLAGNVKAILPRLVQHLQDIGYFSELKILLIKFCGRIMV